MKKIAKKFIIILLIVFLICLQYKIFAVKASELTPLYTKYNGHGFKNFAQAILGYIRNIAAVSSVVLLAFFGLKFMLGSLEQKAEYKKHLLPLTIGIAVVLLGTSITSMVWDTIEAEPHDCDWGGAKCGSGATCSICGTKIPEEHSWQFQSATPSHCYKCLNCGEQVDEI